MTSPGPSYASTPPRARAGRSPKGLALQLAAAALSFMLVALLVTTASRAAFTAQTENAANSLSAATVDLSDNDSGAAMFVNVPVLTPGRNEDRCIDVTYTGTVNPGPVLLYATAAPTGGLAPYLNLQIDMLPDTPDAFGSCSSFVPTAGSTLYTGTLSAFATARSSYAAPGLTTWDPVASGETRTFRFRVSVQDTPGAESQTSTFGFTWETRNT